MLLYGKEPGKPAEFTGAYNGFRCFHVLTTKRQWTYLVDTESQTLRKCDNDTWKKLERKAWLLDKKGRRINDIA